MAGRKALHVNAGNMYGGIETLLGTLARSRALCLAWEQHFAVFFEGRSSDELRAAGVPVHVLGGVRVSRPWTVWTARRRLRELLRRERFDLVITHGCWNHALAAPVARRGGVPVVFWGHMIELGKHWVQRWAKGSPPALVLANSRATQESVSRNLFPAARSEVLYLPVSPPAVDAAEARREVRRELGTPEGAAVVVVACRMEAWKGHAVLLEALGRFAGVANWECWIAGAAQRPEEERYQTSLKEQAQRLGIDNRVRLLGQRSDVARLMAAADVHCQPNTSPEPFGIAFVEALYAGLPVVTSDIGGAKEIIDPSCGLLLPPGDAALLAEALRSLLDPGTRAKLAAGGPARAAALCDPARQVGRLGELLVEACGDDRASRHQ